MGTSCVSLPISRHLLLLYDPRAAFCRCPCVAVAVTCIPMITALIPGARGSSEPTTALLLPFPRETWLAFSTVYTRTEMPSARCIILFRDVVQRGLWFGLRCGSQARTRSIVSQVFVDVRGRASREGNGSEFKSPTRHAPRKLASCSHSLLSPNLQPASPSFAVPLHRHVRCPKLTSPPFF